MSENILTFIYTINLRKSNLREINTKNYTYPYILFTIPLENENTLEENENTLEDFRNNFILDNIYMYFNWVYNYIYLIF